ncbi:hypothetical protein FHR56_001365 [Xanthomonas sacchari]|nr:hypothetical protein [Xanthomonas sp. F10]
MTILVTGATGRVAATSSHTSPSVAQASAF